MKRAHSRVMLPCGSMTGRWALHDWIAECGVQFSGDWDEERESEYQALNALCQEASDSPDWKHGETLIRDSYFKEYAQELAKDIGAIDENATWPNDCIDWDRAVRELKYDYSQVDFDGVDYWIRS